METIITSLRDVVRDVKFLVGDLIWIIGDALVLFLSVTLPSPDYISGGTFGASRKGGVTVEKLMRASKPKTFCKTRTVLRLYFPRDCNLTARCNPSHNSKTLWASEENHPTRPKVRFLISFRCHYHFLIVGGCGRH